MAITKWIEHKVTATKSRAESFADNNIDIAILSCDTAQRILSLTGVN